MRKTGRMREIVNVSLIFMDLLSPVLGDALNNKFLYLR